MLCPTTSSIRRGVRTTSPRPWSRRLDESGICSRWRRYFGRRRVPGREARDRTRRRDTSSAPGDAVDDRVVHLRPAPRCGGPLESVDDNPQQQPQSNLIATSSPIRFPTVGSSRRWARLCGGCVRVEIEVGILDPDPVESRPNGASTSRHRNWGARWSHCSDTTLELVDAEPIRARSAGLATMTANSLHVPRRCLSP